MPLTDDPQNIKALKTKLASGEISKKEYQEAANALVDATTLAADHAPDGGQLSLPTGAVRARYEHALAARREEPDDDLEGLDLSGPTSAPALPPLQGEDDEFLFGSTDRPDEAVTTGANRAGTGPQLNAKELSQLSVLSAMASRPDAPPQLAVLLAALAQSIR